jgi:hypothetical protein
MTKQPIDFRSNWLILCSLGLIAVGLGVWWPSPFYPDELAFRIGNTRYIQDGHEYWGLYPFCDGQPKTVPWIFVPALWILSFLDGLFTPTQLRFIPFAATLLCCVSVALYAQSRNNKSYFVLMTVTAIGVSGSGLILTRGEHFILLQLFFCLLAVYNSVYLARSLNLILAIVIVFLTTVTCVTHPQGILFIPVSYIALGALTPLIAHSIRSRLSLKFLKLFITIIFVIISVNYHNFSCKNIPEMEIFFKKIVVDFSFTSFDAFTNAFVAKIKNYIEPFLYLPQYQVMYLPGIEPSRLFTSFNFVIASVVFTSLLGNFFLFVYSGLLIIRENRSGFINDFNYLKIFPALLSIVAYFLLVYDLNQFFYRTFFIHFLLTLSTVLYLLNCHNTKFYNASKVLMIFVLVSALLSIFLNYKNFFYRLSTWDAIATTPKFNVSQPSTTDIKKVAEMCNIDLEGGRLVVDAYTYETLKHSRLLVDVYYIRQAVDLSKADVRSIAEILNFSGVVASCKGMKHTNIGWPADFSKNKICCTKF